MKRLHSSEILLAIAVGVVVGTIVILLSGVSILGAWSCLVLALAISFYAFWRPNLLMLVLAFLAGVLIGGWRSSNFLEIKVEQSDSGANWPSVMRDNYAESIKTNIPEEESALGIAYLLGMRDGLTNTMKDNLKAVGLTHIVVASGTHLSILVEITRKIFGKISRAVSIIFALLFIVIFASMIGWTPSIMRAAVVSILVLTMSYVGRRFRPAKLIILAMAITLMIAPDNLTSLGWLLSFAAYSGILLLAPVLKKFLYGDAKINAVAEILLSSISATLVCLPIQLYYFGELSLLSLPANLLILPTIPYAMGLTFLAGVGGLLSLVGELAGWAAGVLLNCHLSIVAFLAQQEMFLVKMEAHEVWTLWLYVPILLLFWFCWRRVNLRDA